MDADLLSIYEARRAAELAWEAFRKFRGTDVSLIDEMVQTVSSAIEPECARLGLLAAEETGYGNAEDKRLKNLFNCLTVADWLRNVRTLGVLWQDDVTKIVAVGEPMGVVAALIPVTNPTSMIIYKVLSAIKAGTEEAEEALETEIGRSVGFNNHQIAQRPSELAMGDLRRLELARTLAVQPSLLLLDEVFAGLTLGVIDQISELLVERKKHGLTYVMVSHDLRSMAPLVDRVIAISFGEIITEGTFNEVVNNKTVQEAYLGQ